MTEIRLYIEGDRALRQGFLGFFKELRDLARAKNIGMFIKLCGSRNSTFEDFSIAVENYPDAFVILLVDAEARVTNTPWHHLKARDNWDRPGSVTDDHCHLMVQSMESWFLADVANLEGFYKQGFNPNPIPRASDVERNVVDIEQWEKEKVIKALNDAVRNVTSRAKRKYHKTHHAPQLPEALSTARVRKASKHCDRFFTKIVQLIDGFRAG